MSDDSSPRSAPVPRSNQSFLRLLGVVCLLAAAGLQARSCSARKAEARVAREISEAVLEGGAVDVLVQHTLEGMDLPPIIYRCDETTATNLLTKLHQVRPTRMPKNPFDGDHFSVLIVSTNGVVREFRADRLTADPSNALVGIVKRRKNEDGSILEASSAPALAIGAGDILGDILRRLVEEGQKYSSDPAFRENFSNAVERVIAERTAAAAAKDAPAEESAEKPAEEPANEAEPAPAP